MIDSSFNYKRFASDGDSWREPPVRESTRGRKRVRRGLGPGGMRGTIALLCRGGGGISAREAPTVVGYETPNFHSSPEPGSPFVVRVNVWSLVGSDRRLGPSGRRRIDREVRREAGEQYARVPWFALNGVFRPRALRLFPCLSPPTTPLISSTILPVAALTLFRLRCDMFFLMCGGGVTVVEWYYLP